MKGILLIEDNGGMSSTLQVELESRYYYVELAYSYESALDRWDENNGEFDCIIIDLHINPRGMIIGDVVRYKPYFGMAVYDYFIQNKKGTSTGDSGAETEMSSEELDSLESKVILYSGYISNFRQHCRENREWGKKYKNLAQIDKNDRDSIRSLMNKVDNICHE